MRSTVWSSLLSIILILFSGFSAISAIPTAPEVSLSRPTEPPSIVKRTTTLPPQHTTSINANFRICLNLNRASSVCTVVGLTSTIAGIGCPTQGVLASAAALVGAIGGNYGTYMDQSVENILGQIAALGGIIAGAFVAPELLLAYGAYCQYVTFANLLSTFCSLTVPLLQSRYGCNSLRTRADWWSDLADHQTMTKRATNPCSEFLALTDPRLCQFAPAIPTIKSACTNFDFLGPADLAEFGTQTSQLVDACRDILATDTAAITSFCQYRAAVQVFEPYCGMTAPTMRAKSRKIRREGERLERYKDQW